MTHAVNEPEIIDLSHFEFERICLPRNVECDQKATWLVSTACCNIEFPLCDYHCQLVREAYIDWVTFGQKVVCVSCGKKYYMTTDSWRMDRI